MKYKNFLYLSQRCKKEFNEKRPCKLRGSVFDVFSVPFSDGFSFLEEHYKGKIRLCEKFLNEIHQRKQPVNRVAQKERTRRIKDVNENLDYYRRCLMLLDFYKKSINYEKRTKNFWKRRYKYQRRTSNV